MKKVLIVDDSEVLREDLKKILSTIDDLELVGEAENAQRAIQFVKKMNPDILILDINLQIGNGIDVLSTLKKSEINPIIIMFTNYASDAFRTLTYKLGAKYFFDKSHDIEKLIDTLKNLATSEVDVLS
jgi:DNA-binding NarL/FixJ family response regulator